jgi:hypothetical protein
MVYNMKSFVGLTAKEAMATQNQMMGLTATMDQVPSSGASVLDTSAGAG